MLVAGVGRARRLDQQELRFFGSGWLVLNTDWNDEQLAGAEFNLALVHSDRDAAGQDEKEVIGVVVMVPYKLSIHLRP